MTRSEEAGAAERIAPEWLMANHLKHGMMTVRPVDAVAGAPAHAARASGSKAHGARYGMGGAPNGKPSMSMIESGVPRPPVPVMAALSFLALAAGVTIAFMFRPL